MALRAKGNEALGKGKTREAAEIYQLAVKEDPEKEKYLALSNLSAALLKLGEKEKALAAAEECKLCRPKHGFPKAFVRVALAYDALGNRDEAKRELEHGLQECTSDKDRELVFEILLKVMNHSSETPELQRAQPPPAQENDAGDLQKALLEAKIQLELAQKEFENAQAARSDAEATLAFAQEQVTDDDVLDLRQKKETLEVASKALSKELESERISVLAQKKEGNEQNHNLKSEAKGESGRKRKEKYQVSINARGNDEAGVIEVEWEWFCSTFEATEEHREDYIGLYAVNELDPDEYWNMEADVAKHGKCGSLSMRKPSTSGIYEFRYISEGNRCAGRSQLVVINEKKEILIGGLTSPRFLLIKEPNLLVYWLYLPLATGTKVDISGTNLPAFTMTNTPDPRVPTMMTKQEKTILRVFAPRKVPVMKGFVGDHSEDPKFDRHLVPYLDVQLDERIDVDRSTLSLHGGDFLAARLAFANAFSANRAKLERKASHPLPEELDPIFFKDGMECRNCGVKICCGVERTNQSSYTPWVEMLEHLTCVPPEDYRGEGPSKAFRGEALGPSPSCLMIDEAFFDVDSSDMVSGSLRLCQELVDVELPLDDTTAPANFVMRNIECRGCSSWIGKVQEDCNLRGHSSRIDSDPILSSTDESKRQFMVFRLYKHTVRLVAKPELLSNYDPCGTFFGSQLSRLADVREIREVTIYCRNGTNCEMEGVVLNLWTSDSWFKDQNNSKMFPVLKVTYKAAPRLGLENSGGILATKSQYADLLKQLEYFNSLFPLSARQFDDLNVSLLRW